MRIVLSILFPFLIFAQTETLIVSTVYAGVSGVTAFYQMKDRELYGHKDLEYKDYARTWHNLQFAEAGLLAGAGVSIALTSDNIYEGIKQSFLLGAVRWNVRDGVYNLCQGNSFYNISNSSYSSIESFGTWYIKLGVLVIVLIWNYL